MSGQGWLGPMLCTVKWGKKKSHAVESSTWPLNSHNCSENYPKTKTNKLCNSSTASGEGTPQLYLLYFLLFLKV